MNDASRDFSQIASVVLYHCKSDISVTNLTKAIKKTLDTTAPFTGFPAYLQPILKALSESHKAHAKAKVIQEIIPLLVQQPPGRPMLQKTARSYKTGNYTAQYEAYSLSEWGSAYVAKQTRNAATEPILLPVPDCLRKDENDAVAKRKSTMDHLCSLNVDLSLIPADQLERGDGEDIRIHTHWHSTLQRHATAGNHQQHKKLTDALQICIDWRDVTAEKFGMAPGNVLTESMAMRIAYSGCRSLVDLTGVGVRNQDTHELAALLMAFYTSLGADGISAGETAGGGRGGDGSSAPIALPPGQFKGPGFVHAIFPAGAKKEPVWLAYSRMWHAGATIAAVAASNPTGKSVMASTVIGHVLTNLLYPEGLPVDLQRLAAESASCGPTDAVPTVFEFRAVAAGCAALKISPQSHDYIESPLLSLISAMDLPPDVSAAFSAGYVERTEGQKQLYQYWSSKIRWYRHLTAAGVSVDCSESEGAGAGTGSKRALPASLMGAGGAGDANRRR